MLWGVEWGAGGRERGVGVMALNSGEADRPKVPPGRGWGGFGNWVIAPRRNEKRSRAPVQNSKSAEIGQNFRTLSTHIAPFDSAQGAIRASWLSGVEAKLGLHN